MVFEIEDLVDPVVVLELVRLDVLRVEHSAVNDHQPGFWRGRGSLLCPGHDEEVNWSCVSHTRYDALT